MTDDEMRRAPAINVVRRPLKLLPAPGHFAVGTVSDGWTVYNGRWCCLWSIEEINN